METGELGSRSLMSPRFRVLEDGRNSHGFRAFIPVTDGTYIAGPPSVELARGRVNGLRLLVGVGFSTCVLPLKQC